jgi:hypothetical protein
MKRLISLLLFLPTLAFADVSVPRAKQYAWTQYDVAVLGGASTPKNLGLTLPAGAIITDVWVYINTQYASAGTESLGLQCAGTLDLMAYTPMSAVPADRIFASRMLGNTFNGSAAPIPASPTNLNFSQGFGSVPTACNVTAVVRSDSGYNPYTAGNATFIIEYFKK